MDVNSLLKEAVLAADLAETERLLAAGANPSYYKPPIFSRDDEDEREVKLDFQYYDNNFPTMIDYKCTSMLAMAAMAGSADIVRALLKARCNPNITYISGGTSEALAAAVAAKNPEMLTMLFEYGAILAPPQENGDSYHPFTQALRGDYVDCLEVMIKYASDDFLQHRVGYHKQTWLHVAVEKSYPRATAALLKSKRVPLDAVNSSGSSLLQAAVSGHDYENANECVDLILQADPSSVDVCTSTGNVLHALSGGIRYAVTGVDIYAPHEVRLEQIKAAATTLAARLDVFGDAEWYNRAILQETSTSDNPFHSAVARDNAVVLLALAMKIRSDDVLHTALNNCGSRGTVMQDACYYSHIMCALVLRHLGACPVPPGMPEASAPVLLAMEQLPFSQAYGQSRPKAANYGYFAALLPQWGADLNAQDENGDTACHLLLREKREGPVVLLVCGGAMPCVTNAAGLTPIQLMQTSTRPDRAWGLSDHVSIIQAIGHPNTLRSGAWNRRKAAIAAWAAAHK